MANPQVRITKEAMDELAKRAKPFESPSDCLKRVLAKSPCGTQKADKDASVEETEEQSEDQDKDES